MARLTIILFLILGVGCGSGSASDEVTPKLPGPYIGYSAFAMMHPDFPCDEFLTMFEDVKQPAVSVLFGTFGSSLRCLDKFTDKFRDRPHLVQFHFSNEAGRRNNRLGEGEFLPHLSVGKYDAALIAMKPGTKDAIIERVQMIRITSRLISQDNTAFILGIGLEDNLSTLAARELARVIGLVWDYEMSRNPLETDEGLPDFLVSYIERHGVQPEFGSTPCIANPDGVSVEGNLGRFGYVPRISIPEFRVYLQENLCCKAVFGWTAEMQGLTNQFMPPMRRQFIVSSVLASQLALELELASNLNYNDFCGETNGT